MGFAAQHLHVQVITAFQEGRDLLGESHCSPLLAGLDASDTTECNPLKTPDAVEKFLRRAPATWTI